MEIEWTRVTATWHASGRTPATIAVYSYWARRFVRICAAHHLDLLAHLTEADAVRLFARDGYRPHGDGSAARVPLVAVRALACALAVHGHVVPPWREVVAVRLRGIVAAFVADRVRHRGVAVATRRSDARVAAAFLAFLRARGRRFAATRVVDVDAFVAAGAARWAPKTLAGVCSTLRAFLGFLRATGRLSRDLALQVATPRVRAVERPPRARPWRDVQRLLRAIDVRHAPGRRDYAVFLLMATYGMGAGEVLGLRLEDIDWRARVLRVRRPKTGVATDLPLLAPVARALAAYLQHERPAHAHDRAVFVSRQLPHAGLRASSALRHRLGKYAAAAGLRGGFLGTHLFRFSHATRQVERGADAKVVGDVLGHRRPASTSVYVRGALHNLRTVALPVPR